MGESFTILTAIAAPYDAVNVDTDQILPARFLKMPRDGGYGQYLFHDVRAENPGFILDREPYRAAKIFVGNANFACGSSREGAAFAFYDAGFRSVIAPSFSDIFYNNCLKNGIVPVRLPERQCSDLRALLKSRPGTELTVDLQAQKVAAGSESYGFKVDPFFRELLLKGVDELGLTLSLKDQIEAFERRYAEEFPWAMR
ncbi:MAG: 3-isopropylmalate dehydratase small subunit [Burkholderiales bacterium]